MLGDLLSFGKFLKRQCVVAIQNLKVECPILLRNSGFGLS